jgi:hypothetical protein
VGVGLGHRGFLRQLVGLFGHAAQHRPARLGPLFQGAHRRRIRILRLGFIPRLIQGTLQRVDLGLVGRDIGMGGIQLPAGFRVDLAGDRGERAAGRHEIRVVGAILALQGLHLRGEVRLFLAQRQ